MSRVTRLSASEKIVAETGDGVPPFMVFHDSRFTNDGHYA